MSIKNFRRQLDQDIARARSRGQTERWSPALEAAGAHDLLGPPSSGEDSNALLTEAFANRELTVALRAAVLGELLGRSASAGEQPSLALEVLADGSEEPEIRAVALQSLKLAAIHSASQADWRPQLLDALRTAAAAADPGLRAAAFENLATHKDRGSQEILEQGLDDPGKALVSEANALRFLGLDPHTRVHELARVVLGRSATPEGRLEAVRALGSDPSAVSDLRSVLTDARAGLAVRKVAATGLANLSPQDLREAVATLDETQADRDDADDTPGQTPGPQAFLASGPGLKGLNLSGASVPSQLRAHLQHLKGIDG